jgi:hypothetical protein
MIANLCPNDVADPAARAPGRPTEADAFLVEALAGQQQVLAPWSDQGRRGQLAE